MKIGEFGKRSKKSEVRNIDGGLLVQNTDTKILSKDDLTVVTKAHPSEQDIETALFTWKVLRHAKIQRHPDRQKTTPRLDSAQDK